MSFNIVVEVTVARPTSMSYYLLPFQVEMQKSLCKLLPKGTTLHQMTLHPTSHCDHPDTASFDLFTTGDSVLGYSQSPCHIFVEALTGSKRS